MIGDTFGADGLEAEPHEAVARHHRGEDQCPHRAPPAGLRIQQQPHLAEVDLQLDAGLAIGDPHRARLTAEPQLLGGVAVQRPIRHVDPASDQQVMDLGQLQLVLVQPPLDPVVLGAAGLPRRPVARRPVRTDRLDHHPDQLVGQLRLAAVARQPRGLRRLDIAADGLAVTADDVGDGPKPLVGLQPQPQNLSDLDHGHLPVAHTPSVDTADANRTPQATGNPVGGPMTGRPVVPCSWRNTPPSGPFTVASDSGGVSG